MAKPLRSPLLGYNHNVKYKGRIYHVQTEDSGPTNPRLFTHLYYEGTILATKRHEYDGLAAEDVVRGLMQGQHKSILKDLKQATFDDKLAGFFARRHEPFDVIEALVEAEAIPLAIVDPLSAPLDLDSLPVAIADTPAPDMMQAALPAGGPGLYGLKKTGDSLVPEAPPVRAPASAMSTSSDAMLPVVVFDPAPGATPPPIPRAAGLPTPPPRFPAAAHTPRPVTPPSVVVQRQVVISASGSTGATPPPRPMIPAQRARRPAPAIPYVVKEGSHASANQGRAIPPPRSMMPPQAAAPRTASVAAATPQPDLISDKSLDEVILAYLSQGDAKE